MSTDGAYSKLTQTVLVLSSAVVIFAGLKLASGILAPFLIACALAIILNPLVSTLKRLHCPTVLAVIAVFSLVALSLLMLGAYISEEVSGLLQDMGDLEQNLNQWITQLFSWFGGHNISVFQKTIDSFFSDSNLSKLIQWVVLETKQQLSNYLMIFFLVVFMLLEASAIYDKLHKMTEKHSEGVADIFVIQHKVTTYFLMKVVTSFMTAVLVFIVLWMYDMRYALLFAVLTFFLNFVPIIGSIISAIPPIILALIDNSFVTALSIFVWFLVIETMLVNIVEPKLMGYTLGISALVVLLSMSFWGWILGPAGIILSIPLTICLQYFFAGFEATRWVALMLSDYQKESS